MENIKKSPKCKTLGDLKLISTVSAFAGMFGLFIKK